MNEEFLQYAWKHRLFSDNNLTTTSGEKLIIHKSGQWNTDAGPDFFNASINIGDTFWAGNVEVHINSSDWNKHGHSSNEAYRNVILHVVLNNDTEIKLPEGEIIPTMVITVPSKYEKNYKQLLKEKDTPACWQHISRIEPIYIRSMLDALLVERLQTKISIIEKALNKNKNNWNEVFYQYIAVNFGFRTNALPFEMLSRSLPLSILGHHSNNIFQLEALLFGQSGLLNEQLLGDDYYLELKNEYSFLSKKYGLNGIEGHLWKFMRMRPANFPTVRIAQLAALLNISKNLFSNLIECNTASDILKYFDVKASEYWDTHYRFNHSAERKEKHLGTSSVHNLIINTVVPFLYLYGERNSKPNLKRKSMELLEAIPPEKNAIISHWTQLGINSDNAYDTQALIQLKNVYCEQKRCLNCQIGTKVIRL